MFHEEHKTISIEFPEERFTTIFATFLQNSGWHSSHGTYCTVQARVVYIYIRKDILKSIWVDYNEGLKLWFWDEEARTGFRAYSEIWVAPPINATDTSDNHSLWIKRKWTIEELENALNIQKQWQAQ